MSQIKLKRIKKDCMNSLLNKMVDDYEKTSKINYLGMEMIEVDSEVIKIDGVSIDVEIDLEKYNMILEDEKLPNKYEKLSKLGIQLHKDMKMKNGRRIPSAILYDHRLWAYLSLTVFVEIIEKLWLIEVDDEKAKDKIRKYYFNNGTASRTGFLFLWTMVDKLVGEENEESEENEKRVRTAFEFIDPVKAIYERKMSRNDVVIKAFVDAIIRNNYPNKLKGKKKKSLVPTSISCFAALCMVDAFDYDELVKVMAEQQKMALDV